MRGWPPLLCSLLCLGAAACGSAGPNAQPQDVSSLVEGWELGAEILPLVDPRRGLLVLRYCAGEEPGCEHSTYRHCGQSLEQATSVLREDLEMRKNYTERAHIYECGESECHHPPMMDYDYEGTLRFDTSVEPPVLIEVLHVEGAASPGEIALWAERARASHRTQRCTERSG